MSHRDPYAPLGQRAGGDQHAARLACQRHVTCQLAIAILHLDLVDEIKDAMQPVCRGFGRPAIRLALHRAAQGNDAL